MHYILCFILTVKISSVSLLDYDLYENKYLNYHPFKRMAHLDPISFQLCIMECERLQNCSSVNFNSETLQCDLTSLTHLDEDTAIIPLGRRAYVFLKQKNKSCQGCGSFDVCTVLSSGDGVCISTACFIEPPQVNNSVMEMSGIGRMVNYSCISGFTFVGSGAVSYCVNGQSWTPVDFRCEKDVDGGWSAWGLWSACSVSCGGVGLSTRWRTCTNPAPRYNGAYCNGSANSTADCSTGSCPVDGGWSTWGSWSECSETCGGGIKTRTRSCTNPAPLYNGRACNGSDVSTVSCSVNDCPVDGCWSWNVCSVTCGNGVMTKTRSCTNPVPLYYGRACDGTNSATVSCFAEHCPIDGGWSTWGPWSECSVTCGNGIVTRARSCTNPAPLYNGRACNGSDVSTVSCRENNCSSCSPERSILSEGTVSMSSVHKDLNKYWLHSPSSWSPFTPLLVWIEISFQSKRNVTAILTQGRADAAQWVISYYVYDRPTPLVWNKVSGLFQGNSDSSSVVTNFLDPMLETKRLTIVPSQWYDYPSLRFDIIGC